METELPETTDDEGTEAAPTDPDDVTEEAEEAPAE